MAASEKELAALREAVGQKQEEVSKQKEVVKSLKDAKAGKKDIDDAVQALKALNIELDSRTKELSSKHAEADGKGKSHEKQKFRNDLADTLKTKLFFLPAFGIYGGVAGLYDYGPPGCAVKANVLSLWRQHYVLEEGMLEVDCPCVTPEIVFKASGHVDKFTDLMVKDQKTGESFRADHLLKWHVEDALEKDPMMSDAKREEMKEDLAKLDDYSAEELGAKLKLYGIVAPETKNPLTDPFPFNLMFGTQIGPAGNNQGYLRPETAQGIFVNFKELYHYNGDKLPFAAAQIGQAFRNEISPRQGLLRVREFTLAEIEHFVDPEDKSHPKFKDVADIEFLLFPRHEQTNKKSPVKTTIGTAVEKGIVNNETLGYFIARTYLFLTKLGIDKNRLRFRQHLQNEMAHYAADCWDAEIECTYGWIEVTGLADRSAYDLKAHQDKSKVDMTAFERYSAPKMIEELKIQVKRQLLGPAFKKDAKVIAEALESMKEEEAMAMKQKLESNGTAPLEICTTGQIFTITKDQVSISKETEKRSGKKFVPGVIEPSFGIGRIIYCLYEHCFYKRPSKAGDEQLSVFRFPPVVAPIKCTVFSLRQDADLNAVCREVHLSLTRAGVANKMDLTGTSIGKRYARTDELGVPFAVTVDYEFKQTVTLRERDSRAQVRIPIPELSGVVSDVADGKLTWTDVASKYPAVTSTADED